MDAEQEAFLAALIHASSRTGPGAPDLVMVQPSEVFEKLGWSEDEHDPTPLLHGLASAGYVGFLLETGPFVPVRPTYLAAVRVTQRVATEWEGRVTALLSEGETTTVDLKRELHVDREREKGEVRPRRTGPGHHQGQWPRPITADRLRR